MVDFNAMMELSVTAITAATIVRVVSPVLKINPRCVQIKLLVQMGRTTAVKPIVLGIQIGEEIENVVRRIFQ